MSTNGKDSLPVAEKCTAPTLPERRKIKLFVLDSNVVLHDPQALFKFEEHDVLIPMQVIYEADNNKKGISTKARNAREFARILKLLLTEAGGEIMEGITLTSSSNNLATGKLFFETQFEISKNGNGDDVIIESARKAGSEDTLRDDVVFVTMDNFAYIKATLGGVHAEDLVSAEVEPMSDNTLVHAGFHELDDEFWKEHTAIPMDTKKGVKKHQVTGPAVSNFYRNEIVFSSQHIDRTTVVEGFVGDSVVLRRIKKSWKNYTDKRNSVFGITANDLAQNVALNYLMDPDIDIVTILGNAGSGKTILTLAAALQQTYTETVALYDSIIVSRVGNSNDELGYLPGSEEEKMCPWLPGVLEDNLDYLIRQKTGTRSASSSLNKEELMRRWIQVKHSGFMKGSSYMKRFIIIEEAQDAEPEQIKKIITRAGQGTKVVLTGNVNQIDSPFLTERSSGLIHAVKKFYGWKHAGHVILPHYYRSRLVQYANRVFDH